MDGSTGSEDDSNSPSDNAQGGTAEASRRSFLGKLVAGTAAVGMGGGVVAPSSAEAQVEPAFQQTGGQNINAARRQRATQIRYAAAERAATAGAPSHRANGDERGDLDYALSFTKGLPHDYDTGLVAGPNDFEAFVRAVDNGGAADIAALAHGPADGRFRTESAPARVRGWESPTVGRSYDLVGLDMQAISMPAAPSVGSPEQIAEMAEVYTQALLRDEPLAGLGRTGGTTPRQADAITELGAFDWFAGEVDRGDLSTAAIRRLRRSPLINTAFRGIAPGDSTGPYVSQLLLAGSPGADGRSAASGLIDYGAQRIDQRVNYAAPVDFMTSWDAWFDVQNALYPARRVQSAGKPRFITTGRDLATFVHSDALYQPYFNAALLLLSHGTRFDAGAAYAADNRADHQEGFVLFNEPHLLAMLAEVCMRALKTVFFQKFNVHRRLRPEAMAGRIARADVLEFDQVVAVADALDDSAIGEQIRSANAASSGQESMLLPMAFPEGSPMHPSYGAGHGVVAGACCTILKALFDHRQSVAFTGTADRAFAPTEDGSALVSVPVFSSAGRPASLTVEGEINKLAANIAIGRNWAGVHYFTDYWESILCGERIALEVLRDHMLTMIDAASLEVPLFEGGSLTLTT